MLVVCQYLCVDTYALVRMSPSAAVESPDLCLLTKCLTYLTCIRAKLGRGPDAAPRWLGGLLAKVLLALGPKGLEFGRYSIDYHYSRNWLYVQARSRAANGRFGARFHLDTLGIYLALSC